jgi:pyruvate dehydrogenase E2 component (dihydrolipoamide acetyltransferase)
MPELLRIPEVAAGATEAVLSGWPLAENTAYSTGDVIATVETAKAAVDIEAEASGVILRRLVAEGAEVAAGEPIALIGAPGESVQDIEAALVALGAVAAGGAAVAAGGAAVAAEAAAVPVGGAAVPAGGAHVAAGGAHVSAGLPSASASRESRPAATGVAVANHERVFASPIARRMARIADLDVTRLSGTGPNGRILRRDVERAIAAKPAVTVPVAVEPDRRGDVAVTEGFTDLPHSRLRQAIAARLTESKTTVPHFYLRATIRVDKLLRLRAELNADEATVRISINDLLLKAVARAHVMVPAMNVIWTPEAIRSFESVDIGVAIASPRGLVTPVLCGVQRMSVSTVADSVRDFVRRAGAGQLQQRELEGGTTAVTNLGMFGTEEFAAIINPPQSSILAVGAVQSAPVAVKGDVAVRPVLRLTLSVDHRAVDGATAAEWMRALQSVLEHPLRLLA